MLVTRTDTRRATPGSPPFVLSRTLSLLLLLLLSLAKFFFILLRGAAPPQRDALPRTESRIRGPEGGKEGWTPMCWSVGGRCSTILFGSVFLIFFFLTNDFFSFLKIALSDLIMRGVESFRLAKITAGFVNGLLPIHPSSQASHIY